MLNNKLWLYIVLISIVSIVLYPILDIIYCNFITHSSFVYSYKEHIVYPLIVSIVISIVMYLINNSKK